ncbi:MAG: hypothetical protein AB1589_39970 [Cyanobacteriota bacterium]
MSDYEVGFPDGQFAAFGIDLQTAHKLGEAFHKGTDPQPIINQIPDPQKRAIAQRITNNLANHSARGKQK